MFKIQLKLALCLCLVAFFLASCGSRRKAINTPSNASKMADAMAKLSSEKLYNFITGWAGVKYVLGGNDKNGIDCSGFALKLQKEIYNKDLPRRSKEQAEVIKSKNLEALKEGDLIFFSFGGVEVDHVGVYLNNGFFVHASTTRGVVVDDLSIPVYQKTLVKSGTIK